MQLVGKTILITGASSGIGRELARQLAEKQNRLILIARRKELLESLAEEVKRCNSDLQLFACDVADAEQVREVCGVIQQRNDRIDLLLLNAGLSMPFDAEKIDLPAFQRVMDVNFWGAVYFIKHLTPLMIRQGGGIIAAVGSLAGYRGMPRAAAYSCSKAALMNLIDSLRIDLYPHRIRCTLISPGFVDTPMTQPRQSPMPFLMSAEKAARIIIRGLEREKTEIAFPWPMAAAARLSRFIPDRLYARLMQGSFVRRKEGR